MQTTEASGFNPAHFRVATLKYQHNVTGAFSGCRHVEEVLRFALDHGGPCGRLAANFIRTHHGGCWNAMAAILPADGWIRWYTGGGGR